MGQYRLAYISGDAPAINSKSPPYLLSLTFYFAPVGALSAGPVTGIEMVYRQATCSSPPPPPVGPPAPPPLPEADTAARGQWAMHGLAHATAQRLEERPPGQPGCRLL